MVQRGHPGNQLGVEFLQVTSPSLILCACTAHVNVICFTRAFFRAMLSRSSSSLVCYELLCLGKLRLRVDRRARERLSRQVRNLYSLDNRSGARARSATTSGLRCGWTSWRTRWTGTTATSTVTLSASRTRA